MGEATCLRAAILVVMAALAFWSVGGWSSPPPTTRTPASTTTPAHNPTYDETMASEKSATLATVDLTRNRSLKSSDSQRGFSQAGKESLFIEVWVPPA